MKIIFSRLCLNAPENSGHKAAPSFAKENIGFGVLGASYAYCTRLMKFFAGSETAPFRHTKYMHKARLGSTNLRMTTSGQ